MPTARTVSPDFIRPPTASPTPPLAYVDVYMNDFIGLAQPSTKTLVLRTLLSGVSDIFRQESHRDDLPVRKHVISASS
jgi:hypothetical protein